MKLESDMWRSKNDSNGNDVINNIYIDKTFILTSDDITLVEESELLSFSLLERHLQKKGDKYETTNGNT